MFAVPKPRRGYMRITRPLVAALAALGVAAPAAQAHHLDQDTSTVACVLVGNVPTVQIVANFKSFARADQPVHRIVKIDYVTVLDADIPIWDGPDYSDRPTSTVASGRHFVTYDANWNNGDNYGGLKRQVDCPVPVPPTPTPTPTPSPTPTPTPTPPAAPPTPPVVDCNGAAMPPGTPAPTCAPLPPAPPCVMTRVHRVRVVAGQRSTITVRTTDTSVGTLVTLKLPYHKPITRATNETGTVVFSFRAKHRGMAHVTAPGCGTFRARVRPKKHTTSHRPPRTVG
jgi:hypothetical protein